MSWPWSASQRAAGGEARQPQEPRPTTQDDQQAGRGRAATEPSRLASPSRRDRPVIRQLAGRRSAAARRAARSGPAMPGRFMASGGRIGERPARGQVVGPRHVDRVVALVHARASRGSRSRGAGRGG